MAAGEAGGDVLADLRRGFGGSVIALVPASAAAQIRQNVTDRFTRHHWPAPGYRDAVPSGGARQVAPHGLRP